MLLIKKKSKKKAEGKKYLGLNTTAGNKDTGKDKWRNNYYIAFLKERLKELFGYVSTLEIPFKKTDSQKISIKICNKMANPSSN